MSAMFKAKLVEVLFAVLRQGHYSFLTLEGVVFFA
jgi:hypothetical protein